MIYTNLLIFLVAIFVFSISQIPETPLLTPPMALLVFVASLLASRWYCRRQFTRQVFSSTQYFQQEKRLTLLSLILYAAVVYLCDLRYYLSFLSVAGHLPALVNIGGLAVFLLFLSLVWWAARPAYEQVFGSHYQTADFILLNLRANLPIVLPWIALSLFSDAILLLPFPRLHALLSSQWGDLFIFIVFIFFIAMFLPPLVRRLWGCVPLPEGPLRQRLLAFCARLNFTGELYLWPLFEGRLLTAAVMGVVPGLRFILLTPAIIETTTPAELEAVLAHEIGHVKKRHLLLYIALLGSFSLLAGFLAEPMIYLLLSREVLSTLIIATDFTPGAILSTAGAVPLLLFMLLFFRYIFGYFMRNFERQADLHVLSTLGSGQALVSTFEKIADLGGGSRDQPSWHHFGIGERIDAIEAAEREPARIAGHDRKVRLSLVAYLLILGLAITAVRQLPTAELAKQYEESVAEAVLLRKARQEPDNALWQRMLGDLMLNQKMEAKAQSAYEKALQLEPASPEIMNNLAWLLLTSKDLRLRDPARALTLARAAAALHPAGYVYDTLATAYWANGLVDEAVAMALRAIKADPNKRRFYQQQAEKFRRQSYQESLSQPDTSGEGQPAS